MSVCVLVSEERETFFSFFFFFSFFIFSISQSSAFVCLYESMDEC